MTKRKLIELLTKLQKREITSEEIVQLKELTDEEIDIALDINNKNEMIDLLKNENFRKILKEEKEKIIEILKRLKKGSVYLPFIIKASTNKNIIESGNLLEIIKLIIRTKGIYQRDQIILIASNDNTISSGKALEICKLISRTDKELLKIASLAATDTHIIRSGNVLEVVKEIIDTQSQGRALKIYYRYMNEYKELSLLESLSNEHIEKIDFWSMLTEDPETAINLIIQINSSNEIEPNEKINKEQIGNIKIRKKQF